MRKPNHRIDHTGDGEAAELTKRYLEAGCDPVQASADRLDRQYARLEAHRKGTDAVGKLAEDLARLGEQIERQTAPAAELEARRGPDDPEVGRIMNDLPLDQAFRETHRLNALDRARRRPAACNPRGDRRLPAGRPGRPAARRASGLRSGADPGEDDDELEPPPPFYAPLHPRRAERRLLEERIRALDALQDPQLRLDVGEAA